MNFETVEFWDSGILSLVESQRRYAIHELKTSATTPSSYYETAPTPSNRIWYEDEETGLVTTDVGKFEKFMVKF